MGQRIVVIDDEPNIRRTVMIVLTRAGYEVLLAASGTEGLNLCLESAPDLVITDIHMPGGNGFETIARLRAVHPRLPVITISGADEAGRLGLTGRGEPIGSVINLKKPFTVRELLDAVQRSLVHGSRAEGA